MGDTPVQASGCVVWRPGPERDELQVLAIHRSRYDDWSLPKGKLDDGEHLAVAAVRETFEETGVDVWLGPRVARHEYRPRPPQEGVKQVTYWSARPVDGVGAAADDYSPNDEVDRVRWTRLDKASALLTYERDVTVLERFEELVQSDAHRARPLVVLRHAKATARKEWDGDDRDRPLSDEGSQQADHLVDLLAALGVDRVVSSDAERCVRTVRPFAQIAGIAVEPQERWAESTASRSGVRAGVTELLSDKGRTVLCTHRPVLPWVFEALGLTRPKLDPAHLLVVHRRRSAVLATELLRP